MDLSIEMQLYKIHQPSVQVYFTRLLDKVKRDCGPTGLDTKNNSREFELFNNVNISPSEFDIERIYQLEKETWIPSLQASRETILTRLQRGHRILTVKSDGEYLGMVGWRYDGFSLQSSPQLFPQNFFDFSMMESCSIAEARSAFIYNVGVKPSCRKNGIGSLLLQRAFNVIHAENISQIFLDSRLPSYNGIQYSGYELVSPNDKFKQAVDRYFINNLIPAISELTLDPTLRFYLTNGFKPWLILKNFIQDDSSGNLRLICYHILESHSFQV